MFMMHVIVRNLTWHHRKPSLLGGHTTEICECQEIVTCRHSWSAFRPGPHDVRSGGGFTVAAVYRNCNYSECLFLVVFRLILLCGLDLAPGGVVDISSKSTAGAEVAWCMPFTGIWHINEHTWCHIMSHNTFHRFAVCLLTHCKSSWRYTIPLPRF